MPRIGTVIREAYHRPGADALPAHLEDHYGIRVTGTARLAVTVDERWPTPVSDALVGFELSEQGHRDEALARMRRSEEGGYSTAWYNLGGMLLTGGQIDEGIAALQMFLREAPLAKAAVQSRLLLGRAFLAKGDAAHAIGEFQQARAMDPSNLDAIGALSDALLTARQF